MGEVLVGLIIPSPSQTADYSSAMDARTAVKTSVEDKLFAIQKVTGVAVESGYFSHTVLSSYVQP